MVSIVVMYAGKKGIMFYIPRITQCYSFQAQIYIKNWSLIAVLFGLFPGAASSTWKKYCVPSLICRNLSNEFQ